MFIWTLVMHFAYVNINLWVYTAACNTGGEGGCIGMGKSRVQVYEEHLHFCNTSVFKAHLRIWSITVDDYTNCWWNTLFSVLRKPAKASRKKTTPNPQPKTREGWRGDLALDSKTNQKLMPLRCSETHGSCYTSLWVLVRDTPCFVL